MTETIVIDHLGDSEIIVPVSYEITSYGADYVVEMLVNRMKSDDIYVPAFQRGFVWSTKQASRFIESLLIGLPVPGIFLSKDLTTRQLLVIDGQQRLKSLQFFYEGIFFDTGREFKLHGVLPPFEGLSYRNLSKEDRRRLDNSIIHATIIQQEKPQVDDSSIYYIFERINTGGTVLQPQEIRSSIYHGELNLLLRHLNDYPAWRTLFGPIHKRMKDQELILRFFALYYYAEDYRKPMREFLNWYMSRNRDLSIQSGQELEYLFTSTVTTIADLIGKNAFIPARALNAAVYDAVMIGVAKRLSNGHIHDQDQFLYAYQKLVDDPQFIKATSTSTADESSVKTRLELAIETFMNVD